MTKAVETAWDERLLRAAELPGQWVTIETFSTTNSAKTAKSNLVGGRYPLRTSDVTMYELRVVPKDGQYHLQARLFVAYDSPPVAPYHADVVDVLDNGLDYNPSSALPVGAIELAFLQAQSGQWRDMSLVLVHCWPSGTQLVLPKQLVDYLVLIWEDVRKSNMAQEATHHAE